MIRFGITTKDALFTATVHLMLRWFPVLVSLYAPFLPVLVTVFSLSPCISKSVWSLSVTSDLSLSPSGRVVTLSTFLLAFPKAEHGVC